jgi:membrane protein
MKLGHRQAWRLLKKTVQSWSEDYAPSMGAALAFYTLFSIAPLLLIVIAVAGYFFGADAVRGEVVSQLSALMGIYGSHAVESLLASANGPARRSLAAGIGIVVFLVGATSVFNELQDSLNRIWRVTRANRTGGFFALVWARLLSFGMILGIAFLLMVSLLVSACLAAFGRWWGPVTVEWQVFVHAGNFILSFALITVMFALIYKIIPQKKVHWGDVWMGAAMTAMLFSVGKELIGIYLGRSIIVTAFGAVGSLAVFLLWVYYSAQIFLLGAEFTWIYSGIRTQKAAAAARGLPEPTGAAELSAVPKAHRPSRAA